jgi:hypothetical protein
VWTATARDPAPTFQVATVIEKELAQHYRRQLVSGVQRQCAFKGRLNLVVASCPPKGCREAESVNRSYLLFEDGSFGAKEATRLRQGYGVVVRATR